MCARCVIVHSVVAIRRAARAQHEGETKTSFDEDPKYQIFTDMRKFSRLYIVYIHYAHSIICPVRRSILIHPACPSFLLHFGVQT